jgi:hypothetical protein
MEEIQVPMKQLDEENPDKNFSDEREETTHVFPPGQLLGSIEFALPAVVHEDRIRWNQTGKWFMGVSICVVLGGIMAISWMVSTTLDWSVSKNCTEPCNGWYVSV